MKTLFGLFTLIVLIAAGSSLAQAQSPKAEDLSNYSLKTLISARWKLMTDATCAKANLGSWFKKSVPTEVRYSVDPGQMVSDMYSGITKNLEQVMNRASSGGIMSQADSDAEWCYGQSLVADKLDAAISARLKAQSAADYEQANASYRKLLQETETALHIAPKSAPSASGQ